jgi:hypothetical protein
MLVVIESPWAGLGAGEKAKKYLRACIRDALARNEIPWASHAMLAWTEALYETDEEQRSEGINVNKLMILKADLVAFYVDKGMSAGMHLAQRWCVMHGKKFEKRTLYA